MTREEFIQKISPWLTEGTRNAIANAAEEYFASNNHGTCYEKMAFYMGDYPDDPDGLSDFLLEYIDDIAEDDDIAGMTASMVHEW